MLIKWVFFLWEIIWFVLLSEMKFFGCWVVINREVVLLILIIWLRGVWKIRIGCFKFVIWFSIFWLCRLFMNCCLIVNGLFFNWIWVLLVFLIICRLFLKWLVICLGLVGVLIVVILIIFGMELVVIIIVVLLRLWLIKSFGVLYFLWRKFVVVIRFFILEEKFVLVKLFFEWLRFVKLNWRMVKFFLVSVLEICVVVKMFLEYEK